MENKYVKTFEQYSADLDEAINNGNLEDFDQLDEGLKDWLKGVNWIKKNWRFAFVYYKTVGGPNAETNMKNVVEKGLEEEKNDWPFDLKKAYGDKAKSFEAFRTNLGNLQAKAKGSMIIQPGGTVNSTAQDNKAKDALKEWQKNPEKWTKEIEDFAKKA